MNNNPIVKPNTVTKGIAKEYHLERFKSAQDLVYHRVVAELEQGFKQSHWMWFIFPQIDGLGQSATAKKFAIKNKQEAALYCQDPLLAGRLNQCCELLLKHKSNSAQDILGYPDDLKLHSCMTLFVLVSKPNSIFQKVIDKFYQGKPDQMTLGLL